MKHLKNIIGKVAASLMVLSCIEPVLGNNIAVQNVQLVNRNASNQTIDVQFDLSWENSWRVSTGPANWDAAWVFLKFRGADGIWRHGSLSTTNTDHTMPSGATVQVGLTGSTGMGAFIYRTTNGSGNIAWPGVKLKWRYGANGVTDTSLVSVDVSAVEMVYVPQGSFFVGDGSSLNRFGDGGSLLPFNVTTDGDISCGPLAGQLWAQNQGSTGSFVYSSLWPTGYNAFYAMKYEVTQGQYVDAANKGVQFQYYPSGGTINLARLNVEGSVGAVTTSYADRAYVAAFSDYINLNSTNYYPSLLGASSGRFSLVAGYLNWAGLRPMAELEYEKACRGPSVPIAGEFAWGTSYRNLYGYTMQNDGMSTEGVTQGTYQPNSGNAIIGGRTLVPHRVGMFALPSYTGTTPPRIQAGASYYGLLEMTGNVQEPVLSFTGGNNPGTAIPLGNGDGTIPTWSAFRVRGSSGPVSERDDTALVAISGSGSSSTTGATRSLFVGIRGVREAP